MVISQRVGSGPHKPDEAIPLGNKALEILRFWRDVEAFTIPAAPSDRDNSESTKVSPPLIPDHPLPWGPEVPRRFAGGEQWEWTHNVFVGVADMERLAQGILAACLPGQDLSEGERNRIQGRGWMAGFVLDEEGRPVSGSYVPASFTFGAKRLREGSHLEGLSDDLQEAPRDFNNRRHCPTPDPEGEPPPPPPPMGWPELIEELEIAVARFGGLASGAKPQILVKSVRKKRIGGDRKADASDLDFLNSFYLNDLDLLIRQGKEGKSFGKALGAYLGPEAKERIDLLANVEQMALRIDPGTLPASRWPSNPDHHLYLAQQAAVSTILAELGPDRGLIAVNGPPGTGKTTLLCDVIADIVTRRALVLSRLASPWDAFEERKVKVGTKDMAVLRRDDFGMTGIVVASNNNSAVENISRELPSRKKIHEAFGGPSYFREVSDHMFKTAKVSGETWGLIAGALGSASRRSDFAKSFFREDQGQNKTPKNKVPEGSGDPLSDATEEGESRPATEKPITTMKQILEACTQDGRAGKKAWEEARDDFRRLHKLFLEEQGKLARLRESLVELRDIRSQHRRAEALISEAKENLERVLSLHQQRCAAALATLAGANSVLSRLADEQETCERQVRSAKERVENERLDDPPAFWERFLNSLFGMKTRRYSQWEGRVRDARAAQRRAIEKLDELTGTVGRAKTAVREAEIELNRTELAKLTAIEEAEDLIRRNERERQRLQERIGSITTLHQGFQRQGITIPDDDFWMLPPEARHLSHPWLSSSLDELRSKVFLGAIRLHEHTARACATKFIALLRGVRAMLMGSGAEPLTEEARARLWDALFFVVPVVSTTLASFDRLFQGMGQESLGWLLVDEAGQATPQSVAGAIWRSRRAVIVGDPKQVEPVLTIPGALVKTLRERYPGVGPEWSPTESAQSLTDRVTPWGAWIGNGDADESGSVWTGLPLRAHRRCDFPMFDVANAIAYSGQMVQTNTGTNPQGLGNDPGPSQWMDVKADRSDNQVVPDEIAMLTDQLTILREHWPYPPADPNKRAKVYVISPFKRVANACSNAVRKLGMDREPFGVECGTVHKFQGKEAEVVFLVLGSAPGEKGKGSRKWASQQPNILNVALTRAKTRIYVIGNREDWGLCPGFDHLLDLMEPSSAAAVGGRK